MSCTNTTATIKASAPNIAPNMKVKKYIMVVHLLPDHHILAIMASEHKKIMHRHIILIIPVHLLPDTVLASVAML